MPAVASSANTVTAKSRMPRKTVASPPVPLVTTVMLLIRNAREHPDERHAEAGAAGQVPRHPGEVADGQRAHRPSTAARNSLSSRLASGANETTTAARGDQLGQAAIELRHAAAHPPLVGPTLDRRGRGEDAPDHAVGAGRADPVDGRLLGGGAHAGGDHTLETPLVEDRDPVGQPLELVEVVRRDEDAALGAAQLAHDIAEPLGPERVEPVGRLVEHDEVAVADERLRETEPLQRALGELAHVLLSMLLQPEPLHHALGPLRDLVGGHARERGVAPERGLGGPAGRKRKQFRADRRRRGSRRTRAATGPRCAPGRRWDAGSRAGWR